jgi:hypothetical protein
VARLRDDLLPLGGAVLMAEAGIEALRKALFRVLFDYFHAKLTRREFPQDRRMRLCSPAELREWPAVNAYYEALKQRPSVVLALEEEERSLYAAEQAWHRAARGAVIGAGSPCKPASPTYSSRSSR